MWCLKLGTLHLLVFLCALLKWGQERYSWKGWRTFYRVHERDDILFQKKMNQIKRKQQSWACLMISTQKKNLTNKEKQLILWYASNIEQARSWRPTAGVFFFFFIVGLFIRPVRWLWWRPLSSLLYFLQVAVELGADGSVFWPRLLP